MRLQVHLQYVGSVDASLRAQVMRSLCDAGLGPAADGGRAGPGPAVLFTRCNGDEAVGTVRDLAACAQRRILVVTGEGASGDGAIAWRLLRAGAGDVVRWDEQRPELSARGVAARLERWQEVDDLVGSPEVRARMVGRSPPWIAALRELVEVARAPETAVLVTGESGTGKELAARLIHDLDPRPDKRELVLLDCTTIVPTLSGSEFFGHERGAFTDAVAARDGAFAEADRGTLFLDELGELPLGLQGELLRVIQDGMYKRVGSGVWRRTRFRLVCATNRDLREEVARGRFRSDLYHRVAAWKVRLPALRERAGDLPELAEHLLRQACPEGEAPRLDDAVLDVLRSRDYPGNVRELRQLVTRLAARHVGPGPITVGDVPPDERPAGDPEDEGWSSLELERAVRRALARRASLRDIGRAAEEVAIAVALAEEDGNLRRASARLRVTDRALQMRRAASRKNGEPRRSR